MWRQQRDGPPKAVHRHLDWNDKVAAVRWRPHQTRLLIEGLASIKATSRSDPARRIYPALAKLARELAPGCGAGDEETREAKGIEAQPKPPYAGRDVDVGLPN